MDGPLLQQANENRKLVPLQDGGAQVTQWSTERKQFSVQAKGEVTLAIKLLNYPAWEVLIDGRPANVESFEKNGPMLITVPPGTHAVDVRFVALGTARLVLRVQRLQQFCC